MECVFSDRSAVADLPDVLRELQAVEDSAPLRLQLLRRHVALQLAAEQHQVLHEEAHGVPLPGGQLHQGAGVEAQVDVFGAGHAFAALLDPGKRSVIRKEE